MKDKRLANFVIFGFIIFEVFVVLTFIALFCECTHTHYCLQGSVMGDCEGCAEFYKQAEYYEKCECAGAEDAYWRVRCE